MGRRRLVGWQKTERFCASRMTVTEKTMNHALMLELRGQQMQAELGMVDWRHACDVAHTSLLSHTYIQTYSEEGCRRWGRR